MELFIYIHMDIVQTFQSLPEFLDMVATQLLILQSQHLVETPKLLGHFLLRDMRLWDLALLVKAGMQIQQLRPMLS